MTKWYKKIPEFYNFELNVHDYVPEIYSSANFHFNPFSGDISPDGELLRFCNFFLVDYTVFFLSAHPGWNRGSIFTVCGSYDVFSPKDGPFGGCGNIGIHLVGNILQNSRQRAWIGNFKLNWVNIIIAILQEYKHDQRAILG